MRNAVAAASKCMCIALENIAFLIRFPCCVSIDCISVSPIHLCVCCAWLIVYVVMRSPTRLLCTCSLHLLDFSFNEQNINKFNYCDSHTIRGACTQSLRWNKLRIKFTVHSERLKPVHGASAPQSCRQIPINHFLLKTFSDKSSSS